MEQLWMTAPGVLGGFFIVSGLCALVDAVFPQPLAGSGWVPVRRAVAALGHNYLNAANRIPPGLPRAEQQIAAAVDAAVRAEAAPELALASVKVVAVGDQPLAGQSPGRKSLGGFAGMIFCAASLALLTACTAPGAGGGTTITYAQVLAEADNAYAVLKAVADAQVQAGRLNAAQVAQAESVAQAAITAMDAGARAGGQAGGQAGAGERTVSVQSIAQQVLAAIVAFQSLIPSALLPQPVAIAIQAAESALSAFLALDPLTARAVAAHGRPMLVRPL